jgi:RNA polymerase sigma-70 factor, ECF subfamily
MQNSIDNDLALRLLQQCAQEDQGALEQLHKLFCKRIYAFAFNRLRDDEQARTVVIDTMFEVWRSAGKFRAESLVSTWILGIARFKGLKLLESSGVQHEDIEDHAETLISNLEDGEAALSRWQETRQVHRCMETLSPAHRECLQLVYVEGLALAEVAEVQRVPENTVKTRLFHARKNMKECVETGAR